MTKETNFFNEIRKESRWGIEPHIIKTFFTETTNP